MIKTFIFVEDGSVDLDELKGAVGDDVLVVPYRQGAAPPQIQQPRKPISRHGDSSYNGLQNLMTEFDEMGFAPTTVCPNPEAYAVGWRDQVLKEVKALETENRTLREKLDRCAKFSLDYCGEDDGCAGDYTVGLPACPMWCAGDIDDNGNVIEAHCELKKWLAEEGKK